MGRGISFDFFCFKNFLFIEYNIKVLPITGSTAAAGGDGDMGCE